MLNPNPRRQFLRDLEELIEEKRKEGYRPLVMMDMNGDYILETGEDKGLREFVERTELVDVYRERFPGRISTYVNGTKRLDYILMDPALEEAVHHIGYLGTYEGAFLDHVYAYVDFDEGRLFRGKINWPVDVHSRESMLEQIDKKEAFVNKVRGPFRTTRCVKRFLSWQLTLPGGDGQQRMTRGIRAWIGLSRRLC